MSQATLQTPASSTLPDPPPAHLRIALVIDDLSVGGAQQGLTEEAGALIQRGHECHVVVLSEQPGLSFEADLRRRGAMVHHVYGAGLRDLWRFGRLLRLLRSLKPQVVHTYLEYANILGVAAARLTGIPSVASMRSINTLQTRLDGPKRRLQSLILRWGADRIVLVAASAVDESMKNMGLPSARLVVMPNAIDLERIRLPVDFDRALKRRELGASTDEPLVCVTARLDPVKGHCFLISAAAQLRTRHPSTRYLFVGAGSEGDLDVEQRLRAQAKDLNIAEQFAFLGERRDVAEILAASDLFVLPSLAEGLSRALLEAMALGTPVVATTVGGHADVLSSGETGWSVEAGDPDALARAIDDALSSPAERERMAMNARALIQERYTVGPHAERLESLYRNLLHPRQHGR